MRIGLLVSRSGPAGMWALPFDNGAIVAAAELNAAGGVLGDGVELVIADPGYADSEARDAAGALVDIEGVDAVIGLHPSSVRAAIRRELAGRVPYIFTPQYEGGENAPCTTAIGCTDEEMLRPSISWLVERKRAERFYLVGNDYVWPHAAHRRAAALAHAAGGTIVGRTVLPFGVEDYAGAMAAIRRARPDVVVTALLGEEAARFHRAFAECGLAALILRFSLGLEETVLYATGPENAENLFTALNYVPSLRSAANERFLELYRSGFGERAPPANLICQFGYEGVHVIAGLATAVGRTDARSLACSFNGPISRRDARRTLRDTPIGAHPRAFVVAADGTEFSVLAAH